MRRLALVILVATALALSAAARPEGAPYLRNWHGRSLQTDPVAAANRAEAETALAGMRAVLEESFVVENGALINQRLAERRKMRPTIGADANATTLLYPHTPKTGGTSLSLFFQKLLQRRPTESHRQRKIRSTRSELACRDFTGSRDYFEEHFAVQEAVDARYRCPGDVATVREPLSWLHSAYGHKRQHNSCVSRRKTRIDSARLSLRDMTDDGCDFVSWDNFQTCWLLSHIGGGGITQPLEGPSVAELCGRAALDVELLREIDVIIFTPDLSNVPLWLPAKLGLPNAAQPMPHSRQNKREYPESPEASFVELIGQRFMRDVVFYEELARLVSLKDGQA